MINKQLFDCIYGFDMLQQRETRLFNGFKHTVCAERNAHLIPNFSVPPPLGEGGQKFTWSIMYIIDHVNFWFPSPRGPRKKSELNVRSFDTDCKGRLLRRWVLMALIASSHFRETRIAD